MKLNDTIESHFPRLDPKQKSALKRIGLFTIKDLLFYFPARYGDISELHFISELKEDDVATILGKIKSAKTKKSFRTKIPMGEAVIEDTTGSIKIVWFNQAYMAKMFKVGDTVKVTGKVKNSKNGLTLTNPEIEKTPELKIDLGNSLFVDTNKKTTGMSYPVYRETRGITSKWIYHAIEKIFANKVLDEMEDYIPEEILKKYKLPVLKTALFWIHKPREIKDAEASRKRFAFEEVFFIQLVKQSEKKRWSSLGSFEIDIDKKLESDFLSRFPFKPTKGQELAIDAILKDMKKGSPMSRLLEGDVGSGKTLVAGAASYGTIMTRPKGQTFGNLQVAYMAPTEILATQLFESFITYFEHTGINIGLITGSGCRKFPSKVASNTGNWTTISRNQLLKWVENGEIPILIGTHALIQKTVKFKHLALVIIDEQHRFGTNQRSSLIRRNNTEETQNYAEKNTEDETLLYKDITYRIRNCIFNVRKSLGGGHKESVYQNALEEEFRENKLNFSREVRIQTKYRNKVVGTYIPDFVVENKIIVELKALPFIGTQEKKQIWNYLKGSEYKLALLVNFGTKELDIQRIINDKKKISGQNMSVSVQQNSASMAPHFLSMSATPIPRTLALTIYGDLDLTVLDEMPKGRKPVITEIYNENKRDLAYENIKKEMAKGRQLYVICPRIDDPDPEEEKALQLKSVTAEAKRLQKEVFKDKKIGILHSKMTKEKKESVMKDFADKKIDILVATSVVEVGVNVPNATLIIIEGAERFGLAQLHQLRGRVMRSSDQAYCFLFADVKSEKTMERLQAIKTAKNGFELAEIDLSIRGGGELSGARQWGLSDLAMEAIKNPKMVEAAREEALKIVEENKIGELNDLAQQKIRSVENIHFE